MLSLTVLIAPDTMAKGKLQNIIVIKLGGSTLNTSDTTLEDVVALQRAGQNIVLVHGGGPVISDWLARFGIPTRFVRGLRVTDGDTLDVVIAVLAGLVNKQMVAAINARGGRAVGLSGVDGGLIEAEVEAQELGYAGRVIKVNSEPVVLLLGAGYIPVLASVSFDSSGEPGRANAILNVNADDVAGEVAAALGAKRLIFLTDVVGVCDSSGNLIPRLYSDEARALLASGVISGGMIPKIEACLKARRTVSTARIIDGRAPHALLDELEGQATGTTIGD